MPDLSVPEAGIAHNRRLDPPRRA